MLANDKQVAALVGLFREGKKLTYRRGEYVIRPGETPNGVYYIEEGLVKAFNISKYGEENLLIIRKNHEIFPLIWALTGQEREIIYQAISPALLWCIKQETYLSYLQHHTTALPPILDMVTEMYRIHSERLLNLEYRTVRERLISFLITMSDRFGKETPQGLVIDVPLRQQDIASSINSTRETTGRELAILERRDLITQKRLCIVLKDLPKLQSYL